MNIALAVKNFPKLSETFIVREAEYLNADVVTLFKKNEDEFAFDYDFSRVTELYSGKMNPEEFVVRSYRKIEGAPFRTWLPSEKRAFEKFLREKSINVVFTPFGTNAINVLDSCKKLSVPLVIQLLGYDASSLLRSKWYVKRVLEAMDYASTTVILYPEMADALVKLGADSAKTRVITLGVDVSKYKTAAQPDSSHFQFLAVGRFVDKKSPLTTIGAFLKCADLVPSARLTMIGDGPLLDEARALIAESKHTGKVKLLGALPHADVRANLGRSHCFVQHSVEAPNGDKEGWPVGIAEACASGLPVISTRHAGIPTQVVHNVSGFLVDEHDGEKMAEYMTMLAKDPAMAAEFGAAARTHIEKHGNMLIEFEKLNHVLTDAGERINAAG